MAGLLRAIPQTRNVIQVELDTAAATSGAGSAARADNWTITDDLAVVHTIAASVRRNSDQAWRLTLYPALVQGRTYTVAAASTLETSGGSAYTSPSSVTCTGLDAAPVSTRPQRIRAGLDFALPTLGDTRTGVVGGTYQTRGGDYALAAGADAWQSDYLRRMRTRRGGFVWAPDYGCSLEVKRLRTGGSITRLQAEVQRQLLREPHTLSVAPRVSIPAAGLITVSVEVTRADGDIVAARTSVEG